MKAIVKLKSFPDHEGIPGHQGGSLPREADKGGAGSTAKPGTHKITWQPIKDFSAIKVGDRVVYGQYSTLLGRDELHTAPVIKISSIRFVIKVNAGTNNEYNKSFRKDGGKETGAEGGRYGGFHTTYAKGIVVPNKI